MNMLKTMYRHQCEKRQSLFTTVIPASDKNIRGQAPAGIQTFKNTGFRVKHGMTKYGMDSSALSTGQAYQVRNDAEESNFVFFNSTGRME
jgi:hypothetical protein